MWKLQVMDAPRRYFWPKIIMRKRRAFELATLDSAANQSFSHSQRMPFLQLYPGFNRLTDEDKQLKSLNNKGLASSCKALVLFNIPVAKKIRRNLAPSLTPYPGLQATR